MKIDLMIVPADTFMLGCCKPPTGLDPHDLDLRVPPAPGVVLRAIRKLYLSSTCSEGPGAYEQGCDSCGKHGKCDGEQVAGARSADPDHVPLQIGAPLLARLVSGRVEPLYPAADDLVIDDRHKDGMFAQPSFLEPLRGDFARHDLPGLRLLVPTSRRVHGPRLGAYLTRKGVRVWAERKAERLADGDHYMLPRRLYDIEQRARRAAGTTALTTHVRLRPGVGFVLTVEIPDGKPRLELPATIAFGDDGRPAHVEEVQIPQADLKLKPGRRWRLCALGPMPATDAGLPHWIDDKERATLPPYPPSGKLFALACRDEACRIAVDRQLGVSATIRRVIPTGATFFIEYNDPVRVEASSWIVAGGY